MFIKEFLRELLYSVDLSAHPLPKENVRLIVIHQILMGNRLSLSYFSQDGYKKYWYPLLGFT